VPLTLSNDESHLKKRLSLKRTDTLFDSAKDMATREKVR
jgi:hypothetical protein